MKRRIQTKTSRTAEFTCMIRFQSYLEKREQFKSDDYITLVIVNSIIKLLFIMPPVKKIFLKKIYPPGIYEYVIARTKFIDKELKEALLGDIEQVLIFGAGFDSRGIRFQEVAKNIEIFELDAPITQKAKIERYKEKGIKIPENLRFIPVDFNRDSIPQRLEENGFRKDKKTLFILEGLTMYLEPESVDSTFKLISEYSAIGSKVIFDHIYDSVVRRENLYEGEKELYLGVLQRNEKFTFGIKKGSVNDFLSAYGFEAVDILDSNMLEDMFFRDEQKNLLAKVNGTHCIVTAIKN
ncbi:MAG: SAM-dependent methyltransferase [Bacillota bacterium]|nr:SAM-dependent methyltransferase [Bacillota bacterium]